MADKNDVQSVSALLASTLQNLHKAGVAGKAQAGDPRLFFPTGIGLITFEANVGTVKLALRVSSDPKGTLLADESVASAYAAGDLTQGEKVPNKSEVDVCGAIAKKIKRADPEFGQLVKNANPDIVFKDEEGTGADRMMSTRLKQKLDALAKLVTAEWNNTKLRVTEAWDENSEHAGDSLHYEGRAADLTTQPIDGAKLGRLGRLAVDAGFDWVWFEDSNHVHVSVKK